MKKKLLILGSSGMVGSSVLRLAKNYFDILSPNRSELDLFDKNKVDTYFHKEKPFYVINCAAKAGGIYANSIFPADFIYENLLIQNNIIYACHIFKVKKLVFLGSSCIYPKLAPQPLKEEYLLTGSLEPTNDAYALAKIAGIKACQAIRQQFGKDYVSLMPTNLYGTHDNFDLATSHVLPAMIRKFHDAKLSNHATVTLWGTGAPLREFLFVDDMAASVIFALENKLPEHLYNVGTGEDLTIKALAELIQQIVGHKGQIQWDYDKPDGTPRKLMDVSKMHNLGWKHQVELKEGIQRTYQWFLNNRQNLKEIKI
jgi:GDP-L-fucose synthase